MLLLYTLCTKYHTSQINYSFYQRILGLNSIQAMHEGGTIEISISEKDNMAVLEFTDSGEGIPYENLGKVFEPLFTTKQKGTGLGLASCKNIVEQHMGKISVKNNPTTFIIELPKKHYKVETITQK